ncbi:MAG: hypothetical protein ACPGQS_14720 [Bradymonadia bacterium]
MFNVWFLLGWQQIALVTSGWAWMHGDRDELVPHDTFVHCESHAIISQSWTPELSLTLEFDQVWSTKDIFGLVIHLTFKTVFAQPSLRRTVPGCRSLVLDESKLP